MWIVDIVSAVIQVAAFLALVGGAIVAFVWYVRLAPVLELRILPRWCGPGREFLLLRLEVENKSRVRVHKDKILLQMREYQTGSLADDRLVLSDWVSFEEEDAKRTIVATEELPQWEEPTEVFETCNTIDPQEVMGAEWLYYFPGGTVIHVGLQVRAKLGYLRSKAARRPDHTQQWTTTAIALRGRED